MIVKCEIEIESIDGDNTNQTISVADCGEFVILEVGQNNYMVLLTDLETACRVIRAQGEGDESSDG